jgi:hypothetical protein
VVKATPGGRPARQVRGQTFQPPSSSTGQAILRLLQVKIVDRSRPAAPAKRLKAQLGNPSARRDHCDISSVGRSAPRGPLHKPYHGIMSLRPLHGACPAQGSRMSSVRSRFSRMSIRDLT